MYNGFIKVAAAIPSVRVADCRYNTDRMEALMAKAEGLGVEIICFPELSVTGYTCQDLFQQQLLTDEAEAALLRLMEFSRNLDIVALVGVPLAYEGMLLNCAAVIQRGKIHGLVPKTFIPNYKEFYEQRWFTSAAAIPAGTSLKFCGQNVPVGSGLLFETAGTTFGIEICEDLWAVVPPGSQLALQGAEIVFNLSASNELIGKSGYLRGLVGTQSARSLCGYVYAGAGYGESTQDVVFGGRAYIAENGHILSEAERFTMKEQLVVSEIDVERLRVERRVNTSFAYARRLSVAGTQQVGRRVELDPVMHAEERFELTRTVDALPFVPAGPELDERCEEIFCIQSEGLARRIEHTHAQTVVVGISGGLDSTLALLVCVHAFDRLGLDRKGIVGITMPGFGTTDRTYTNAIDLMKGLGITIREISIREACEVHFRDLGHDISKHDVTFENGQARERTQILMDAANQMNGFVVGTGDLSELALGWATYNGDHMSMYGVNVSVPKTLVRHLVKWMAENVADEYSKRTLLDIVDTPISPELIPADEEGNIVQKTEDLVGPYELHDFFLYHVLRFGFRPSKVYYLAKQAFAKSDGRVKAYEDEVIKKWLTVFYRRFFSQQFKRSCLPDGPKVGSCSLSPRGDWRMPSDACATAWINECETL
ncbi:MAG: NAD(+) synthase [Bacteroidaceae bacterium]|nr:NAD(+) synthase [Bacteroidaceae bacterium]